MLNLIHFNSISRIRHTIAKIKQCAFFIHNKIQIIYINERKVTIVGTNKLVKKKSLGLYM